MPRIRVDMDVPAEVFAAGLDRRVLRDTVRRQTVLELLRMGKVSQGRAAEMLGISRSRLFDVMRDAGVPHIGYSPDELAADAAAVQSAP